MTLLQALVLGLVQGATEFLPISSSAHLVLVRWLLGWRFDGRAAFAFDVLVQLGTLVAVLAYFARDLWRLLRAIGRALVRGKPWGDPDARLGWLVLAATVPAAVAGVLLHDWVEEAFRRPALAAAFLLVTAAMLLVAEARRTRAKPLADLTLLDALWIGLAQTLSLFPGISRSGATIAGGRLRGLPRPDAARFAFWMAVPVMIGAGLVAGLDLASLPTAGEWTVPLFVGFAAAALSGYLAIHWLLRYLAHRPLTPFAVYCTCLALASLALSVIRSGTAAWIP